jgi:hypothetical protein
MQDLSPSLSPREKGTDSDSMGISVRASLLVALLRRKREVEKGFPRIYADSLRDCKAQMSADFV